MQIQIIITDGILASNFSFRLSSTALTVTSGLIGYAADWSEHFGYQPADGSGDVFFHTLPKCGSCKPCVRNKPSAISR